MKTENKKSSSPKRSRGAQPGNTNALKHGFYSRQFNKLESSDLEFALLDGLDDEIAMLRVIMRRVFELTNNEEASIENWSAGLSTLGAASTRLAHLLRTQHLIGRQADDTTSALSQALSNIMKEKGYA